VGRDDGRSKASKSKSKNDHFNEWQMGRGYMLRKREWSPYVKQVWKQTLQVEGKGKMDTFFNHLPTQVCQAQVGQVMWVPFHPRRFTLKKRKNISEKKNPPKTLWLVKVRKIYQKGIQGQRKWANSKCIA
jgi:hypothetical protein